jgi:hypothetical protein
LVALTWLSHFYEGENVPLNLQLLSPENKEIRKTSEPSHTPDKDNRKAYSKSDMSDLQGADPYKIEVQSDSGRVAPGIGLRPTSLRSAFQKGDAEAVASAISLDAARVGPPHENDSEVEIP